ncbi:MAG TPA: U32 family peptidase [Casimicrobiaceae bacterium]|nr:U32 family peptidase [Casimicrobiaceae bacterium]
MQLTLGPVPYYWPKARLDAFHQAIAAAPIDRVYLGEALCSRRHEYRATDWLRAAARLADAGKEVVLASQVLMESESDLRALRRLAANGRFMLEANDMGAVHAITGHAPFVAGAHLNIYNAEALAFIASLGAVRWVPPFEMTRDSLASILAQRPKGVGTEVLAYGRLPLAFSARCFTARHYDLPKDDCRFACLDHPGGLAVATREREPFLVLNGIQTQSYRVLNLVDALPDMRELGIDAVRLSPQPERMDEVIAAFRAALDGAASDAVAASLAPALPAAPCNGYWHGRPGLDYVMRHAAA